MCAPSPRRSLAPHWPPGRSSIAVGEDIVIVAARRTPIGAFQGALSGATAPQLGAAAVRAALADSHAGGEQIDEVILGCVLPAGLG